MSFANVADAVGQMRHRIEIIDLTQTIESDYGGQTLTGSTTHATLWAAWEAKTTGSGEQVQSGQEDLVHNITFRTRYLSTVKTDMLIKYESLYYDILSILPDSTRTYMIMEAKQRGDSWTQGVT